MKDAVAKYFTQHSTTTEMGMSGMRPELVEVAGQKLQIKMEAHGTYRGVRYKINAPMPGYSFTYYLYLFERLFINPDDFKSIWLEQQTMEFGSKFYNYSETWLANIGFHGGLTFYRRHDDAQCVEAGCDYNHYWDEGHCYDLDIVVQDVKRTIDSLAAYKQIVEPTQP